MIRTLLFRLFLGLGLLGVTMGSLRAQDTPPPTPPPQTPDTLDLVFEREVFVYPQYERRNPFTPLVSGDQSAPRIEDLQLTAVLFAEGNPDFSVATFVRRGTQTADNPGETYRLKRGERIGNIRIVEIQLRRVVVEVEEFGMTEQRIMELQRPGQGGLS